MRELAEQAPAVPVVAVGFDPAPVLAATPTASPLLTDPARALHRRLGLRRAPSWRVWSPRTLLFYARHGSAHSPAAPTDVRQMGGDAVVVDGTVVACWRPRTPVDRVDPAVLVGAARRRR